MSNDMLSQDEIDALLKGTGDENETFFRSVPEEQDKGQELTLIEQDALGEIGNISFGSSTTALSTLLNQKVEITTPSVSVIEYDKLIEEFPHPYVAIKVNYTEGFKGTNILVINQHDASIIADLMLGGDGSQPSADMGDIHLSAVQEAMNQMMGSAATSMSTIFGKRVDISPPTIDLLNLTTGEGAETIPREDPLVKISFRIIIGQLIDSHIMQVLPYHFAKSLVKELLQTTAEEQSDKEIEEQEVNDVQPQEISQMQERRPSLSMSDMSHSATENGDTYSQPNYYQQPTESMRKQTEQAQIQPANFLDFGSQQPAEKQTNNLDMLLDIPLQLTVELGRTKRSVREILDMTQGSIIELDKLAGEPVDILINSRLIAKGEVVVIDENFGVRVTSIISQQDRLKKLR
ncbi:MULTISPECIES: flagellar motor switch phosphatase FliY [Cytobacillus]|uniref:Flagellar motor switch phosphatase FliY n=1 Tax=Cytobacillus stercorigallinarum TaxID=2762240 RepID=A0ABR8QMG1_9BACI|nr:flagellar motor switch phosphatase FliY [Cytobacillus stercorigallinarum]MBD7936715.1 flagellar motor switch phosphatase FliY [Cytobacillus stercorigallinarum]